MIRSVVVPLDGSPLAEQALDAVSHILPDHGQVTLLTIVRVPTSYFATDVPLPVVQNASDVSRLLKEEIDAARAYLEDKARLLRIKGFNVTLVAETGDPALVISDQARYHDAVMMTTHGRTGFGRLLYGSVTQQVIGLSPRPVIVVPNKQTETAEEEDYIEEMATQS